MGGPKTQVGRHTLSVLLGVLILLGAPFAHSGDLKASIYLPPPSAPAASPPLTPPTAWEFPMPLLLAPGPKPRALPRDLLAILIPKSVKKARARDIKFDLRPRVARPRIAEAAPGAKVSFFAREPVAIKLSSGARLVASRRGAVTRFDEPGLYSFIGEDDPGVWGHVAVGSGQIEMRQVPASGDLLVRDLAPGFWEVFLVVGKRARSAGTVTLSGEGEETPCSFEYVP